MWLVCMCGIKSGSPLICVHNTLLTWTATFHAAMTAPDGNNTNPCSGAFDCYYAALAAEAGLDVHVISHLMDTIEHHTGISSWLSNGAHRLS